MNYDDFLKQKQKQEYNSGFIPEKMNENLFQFQSFCVKNALQKGRFALFEDCGLGKTIQQLEWSDQVVRHTNSPVLILAPLSVSGQTILEGIKFGYEVERLPFDTELKNKIYITNYEQLGNVDSSLFSGIALDESSILKNFEGKMRNLIVDKFQITQYKSCWTATPSPNDPMELGNHAEFLGVMTRNEMLSMYFVHDGGDTAKWRLKKHAVNDFWAWVTSWAIMINKPSDIGFSDEGYILPELIMSEKLVITPKRDNGMIFNDVAVSATNYNEELRLTKVERMEQAADIVRKSEENFIIWVKQNEEADYLKKLLPDAIEVRGNEKPEVKEKKLIGFGRNKFKQMITKTKIAQFGLNYQNCGNQIFASPDFSFESIYQAIRRSWRFGRKDPVNIIIISTDTMQNVINTWNTKQRQFQEMQDNMVKAMRNAFFEKDKKDYKSQSMVLPDFIKTA